MHNAVNILYDGGGIKRLGTILEQDTNHSSYAPSPPQLYYGSQQHPQEIFSENLYDNPYYHGNG